LVEERNKNRNKNRKMQFCYEALVSYGSLHTNAFFNSWEEMRTAMRTNFRVTLSVAPFEGLEKEMFPKSEDTVRAVLNHLAPGSQHVRGINVHVVIRKHQCGVWSKNGCATVELSDDNDDEDD
jgi:hypothetical protein